MLEGPQFVASLATGHLFHSKKSKNQNKMQSVLFSAEVSQLLKKQDHNCDLPTARCGHMFLWHMKFVLLSGPNNHQVAPNQRPIRVRSFNLKFPKKWDVSSPLERSYQTYQEVTVFPVPSLPEMHLKDLY